MIPHKMNQAQRTAERASLVICRMSSFPVQIRGIESLSWLNTVENLKDIES